LGVGAVEGASLEPPVAGLVLEAGVSKLERLAFDCRILSARFVVGDARFDPMSGSLELRFSCFAAARRIPGRHAASVGEWIR
jgi:hypothetical protein